MCLVLSQAASNLGEISQKRGCLNGSLRATGVFHKQDSQLPEPKKGHFGIGHWQAKGADEETAE